MHPYFFAYTTYSSFFESLGHTSTCLRQILYAKLVIYLQFKFIQVYQC
jgi:hypothetical protein